MSLITRLSFGQSYYAQSALHSLKINCSKKTLTKSKIGNLNIDSRYLRIMSSLVYIRNLIDHHQPVSIF